MSKVLCVTGRQRKVVVGNGDAIASKKGREDLVVAGRAGEQGASVGRARYERNRGLDRRHIN